jgi:hypothetical protein
VYEVTLYRVLQSLEWGIGEGRVTWWFFRGGKLLWNTALLLKKRDLKNLL